MKRELAAGLIIKGRRVLLVHNAKHNGLRIEPPGGKKLPDEGWGESVEREALEELGIRVRASGVFGEFSTHSPEGDFTVRMFFCDIVEGEPRVVEPDKIPGFGWYSYEDMLELKKNGTLVPNMAEALERLKGYLSGC